MSYIDWHYFEVWPKLLVLWRNITLFPFYHFSVPLHLRTLFAPWKRQHLFKSKPGLDLGEVFSRFTFNLFSRIIASIMRLTMVFFGLFFTIFFFFPSAVPALLWAVLPGVSLPLYLFQKFTPGESIRPPLGWSKAKKIWVAEHLGIESVAHLRGAPACAGRMARTSCLPATSEDVSSWYEMLQKLKQPPLMFDFERIKNLPGIGCQWNFGYTVELDKYTTDLSQKTSRFPLLSGREEEIEKIERTLLKAEANNALIVGEPGVSRHIIVETLAHRIFMGQCQKGLSHKRVLITDMQAVISSKPSILEVKGLSEDLLKETVMAGNIILVIDEIDKYVSSGEGRIDLSDVLTKFTESPVGFIGITTPANCHKYIKTNSILSPLFEIIEVEEPSLETTMTELMTSIAPVLEKRYGVVITYQALLKTLEDARRFISTTPYPAKAIELLDESCLFLRTKEKGRFLFPKHVDGVISDKFHISVGELQKGEKEKLINLEDLLHKHVINQNQAIHAVSAALRRARLNVSAQNKPVGSFLFLGPTGVGKTETAKALAEVYFGSEKKMLRFDMSQYQKEEGLERLIGSAKLGLPGELTSKLSDNPFSLLLLDEFEKADKDLYNLFLTLLDEGYITDYQGKKVGVKNTIVIATSNAGAEHIRQCVNRGLTGPDLSKELIEYVQKEQIFSPEFLNRFDSLVVFTPLSEGHLREVARILLDKLNKRLKKENGISVMVTSDLIKKLAAEGFDPQFGARAIKRVIAERIEDEVAKRLLLRTVKKGEEIEITL